MRSGFLALVRGDAAADQCFPFRISCSQGMVKIGGELWQARPYDATQVIDAGQVVRVVEVKGATALVWRE